MSKILVVAQTCHSELHPATFSVISAASQLGKDITVLVFSGNDAAAKVLSACDKVSQVWSVVHERCHHPLAEDCAPVISQLANDVDTLMFDASTFGKNMMARVAGTLGIQPISDITQIIDHEHFVRPIYAGNAFEQLHCQQAKKCLSIRPTSFEPAAKEGGSATIENLDLLGVDDRVRFIKLEAPQSERPDLTAAQIVVSGGRALKSAENFKMIEQLADKLGAAVGASRAAVDAGFVPNDYQVGQTGKIVAPKLYFAIGISGAVQHLAGMKDSKIIVAINKDEDAPIFEVADFGLVGDLFTIVPELLEKL